MEEQIKTLLTNPSIVVGNMEQVVSKITSFRNDSPAHTLQVVADFDFTLTRRYTDTHEQVQSSFGALELYPKLSDNFRAQLDAMRDHFGPIDADPTIGKGEKLELVKTWSNSAVQLYVKEKITEQIVKDAVAVSTLQFRDGIKQFVDTLSDAGIPLLILSAGLGTTIDLLLEKHNIKRTLLTILSNWLLYDDDKVVAGITQPLITTATKSITHTLHPAYFQTVQHRSNLLLLGDRVEDESVKECFTHVKNVLTVGFLNENVDDLLHLYTQTYDVVLLGDPDLAVLRELLDIILLWQIYIVYVCMYILN